MKAWVYQDPKQVKKRGADAASWYVGWFDPEGKKRCKSCGTGSPGKRIAEKERRRVEAELLTGTYQSKARKTWADLRTEYEEKVLPGLAPRSGEEIKAAFDHFERLCKPGKLSTLKTAAIDAFAAKRRQERGKKVGSLVSPATINKDLRHLRAAFRKAVRWGHIQSAPYFDMVKVPEKLPTYVTPEHFALIYQACENATKPSGRPYPAADWWRGLLVMAYMTGWRISELLALKRDDLNLEATTALTRWDDNKGDRDALVKLHPVVVEHLKRLAAFDPVVFPWDGDKSALYDEFTAIQQAAKIKLPCREKHEHTPACFVYGFHDFRRAFATMNANQLSADALQQLMRHKSYSTTKLYINMTRQLDAAVDALHVPDVLKAKKAE